MAFPVSTEPPFAKWSFPPDSNATLKTLQPAGQCMRQCSFALPSNGFVLAECPQPPDSFLHAYSTSFPSQPLASVKLSLPQFSHTIWMGRKFDAFSVPVISFQIPTIFCALSSAVFIFSL